MVSAPADLPIGGLGQGELDRLASRARAALEWRQSVESIRAEGAADGVVVTVSGTGSLVDLAIPTPACADGGEALTGRVLDALALARTEAAEAVTRSCAETFGEDSWETEQTSRSWAQGAARRPVVLGAGDGAAFDGPTVVDGPASAPPPPAPPPPGGQW